jgi:hypothetical protein
MCFLWTALDATGRTANSADCRQHFSSLRNSLLCCSEWMNEWMNVEVEVTVFQAMIQWFLQLTLQWLLIHRCLLKSTVWRWCFQLHYQWVHLLMYFLVSVGPGHSLQSWKKQFVWGGLQIIVERQCWYVEKWCSLLLVGSDILQASNINFTFWWIVRTHTVCVPLAPALIQFLGH